MNKFILLIIIGIFWFKPLYSNNFELNDDERELLEGHYFSLVNCYSPELCLSASEKSLEFSKKVKLDLIKNLDYDYFFYFKISYAEHLINMKMYTEAVREYEDIIQSKRFNETQKVRPLVNIGWFYYTNNKFYNPKKAEEYTIRATKSSNLTVRSYALNNLGVMYHEGKFKKDLKKAFKNYTDAANLGNHYSYGNIAKFYTLGTGNVKKDYSRAIYNYKLATIADYGDNDNFELKILLKKGRLPKNKKELKNWYIEEIRSTKNFSNLMKIVWLYDHDDKEILSWLYLTSKYTQSNSGYQQRAVSDLDILLKNNFPGVKKKDIINQSEILFKNNFK